MTKVIEIGGTTTDFVGRRLSNFTPRQFSIDGVLCGSMEGFLQSLKCRNPVRQKEIAALSGKVAKDAGQYHNSWKASQLLYWGDGVRHRLSPRFIELIESAYDALYEQDASFRHDLYNLGDAVIRHTIGNLDPLETVLTEVEFIANLNRLRIRVLFEKQAPK